MRLTREQAIEFFKSQLDGDRAHKAKAKAGIRRPLPTVLEDGVPVTDEWWDQSDPYSRPGVTRRQRAQVVDEAGYGKCELYELIDAIYGPAEPIETVKDAPTHDESVIARLRELIGDTDKESRVFTDDELIEFMMQRLTVEDIRRRMVSR